MKVVNQVKRYLQEVRGDRLNATVKEMELLADFAAWVDKKVAQQSVQRTAEKRGKRSAEEKGEWVRLADSVFPNRRR